MPAPPTRSLRVVKYAPGWGYAAIEWERALAAIDWTRPHADGGPERLKIKTLPDGTKDATVWRATLTLGKREHQVVLKVQPLDSVRQRVQSWLGRTRAFRQWRGTELLARANVSHAPCRAILRASSRGGVGEILVLPAIEGPTLLELLRDGVPPGRAGDLAYALANVFENLDGAGMCNPDAKPSNLIAVGLGTPDPDFVTVDADAVRKGRTETHPLLPLVLEPMGVGLLPSPQMRARVLREWLREHAMTAIHTGAKQLPDRADQRRLFREHWCRVEREAAAHGDPTPKDDPLARA